MTPTDPTWPSAQMPHDDGPTDPAAIIADTYPPETAALMCLAATDAAEALHKLHVEEPAAVDAVLNLARIRLAELQDRQAFAFPSLDDIKTERRNREGQN